MTLRTGHGKGRGRPHVEVSPVDELPSPLPAPLAELTGPVERRHDGKLAGSEAAKALGRLGGRAKAERVRLLSSIGLSKLVEAAPLKPYWSAAEEFTAHHSKELAALAGGSLGSGPSSMVVSASLQLAASRYLFDLGAQTGDPALLKLASALSNDSRQNLLAAWELATREAKSRNVASTPHGALAAALAAPVEGHDDDEIVTR
jgi:hypothetical protein